jgi:hypothetical protein
MASSKFEEAVALADGPQRQQIIKIGARLSQLGGDEGLAVQRLAGRSKSREQLSGVSAYVAGLTGILSVRNHLSPSMMTPHADVHGSSLTVKTLSYGMANALSRS